MTPTTYSEGDPVIYRMPKRSEDPGPRAEEVAPSPQGETYAYVVDKFWRVKRVLEDGRLELVTRTGKTHVVSPDDFHLRRPNPLERLIHRNRFPGDDVL